MDYERIKKIEDRIKRRKEQLKDEKGNFQNQKLLRLKIDIDEAKIKIERIKD